jgi:hypothetical protein
MTLAYRVCRWEAAVATGVFHLVAGSPDTSRSPAGHPPTTRPSPNTGPTDDGGRTANTRRWPRPPHAPCAPNTDAAPPAGTSCCTPTEPPTPPASGRPGSTPSAPRSPDRRSPCRPRTAGPAITTASCTPTATAATQTARPPTRPATCSLPAHAGCLSPVPRRVARRVLRGRAVPQGTPATRPSCATSSLSCAGRSPDPVLRGPTGPCTPR